MEGSFSARLLFPDMFMVAHIFFIFEIIILQKIASSSSFCTVDTAGGSLAESIEITGSRATVQSLHIIYTVSD